MHDQPRETPQMLRRQFLTAAGVIPLSLAASSLVAQTDDSAPSVSRGDGPIKGSPDDRGTLTDTGSEAEVNHSLSRVNLFSAHAVSGAFLATTAHAVGLNRGHISLKHAAFVNGCQCSRLTALLVASNEDRLFALDETAHITQDALILAGFLGLADAAERGIALEPAVISARLNAKLRHDAFDPDHLVRQRPSLSLDSTAAWLQHKEMVVELIENRVSQMVAITSLAAPCATTLAASAFWKDGTDDVAHLCMELALSKQVLQFIERGANPSEHLAELKALAATDANTMLSGAWGYNQLGIMLACNAQGLFGIGTPPNLWYAANHISKDPVGCALSEAKGLVLSETQTLIATSIWLAAGTGQSMWESASRLIKNQYQLIKVLRESFTDAELRSTTFGDGARLAKRLLPILHNYKNAESIGTVIEKIREEIKNTPRPAFQLSLGEWIDRMQSVFERIQRRFPLVRDKIGDIPDLTAKELESLPQLRDSAFNQSLREAISEGNVKAVNSHLEKFQHWRQNLLAQRVAVVLHTIAGDALDHDEDIDSFIRGFGLTSDIQFDPQSFPTYTAQNSRAIETEIAILSRTLQQVASFEGESQRLRSARALYQEGVDIDSILKQLGYVHRDTLKQACDMLVGIGAPLENIVEVLRTTPKETSSENLGDDVHTGYAGNLLYRIGLWIKDSWEDPRNLSESTRDIACVMLTQLPAIPALKVSLTELVKQFANVKDGETISRDQLSKILTVLPPLGYSVAALADNVPGYLILEGVTLRLFQQTFSAEALAQVPHLDSRIGFISKIIASQSGMVFPFSSATNLLQDHIEVLPTDDPEFVQGFGIGRSKLDAHSTLKSGYMRLSAAATCGGAMKLLLDMVREVSAIEDRLNS